MFTETIPEQLLHLIQVPRPSKTRGWVSQWDLIICLAYKDLVVIAIPQASSIVGHTTTIQFHECPIAFPCFCNSVEAPLT